MNLCVFHKLDTYILEFLVPTWRSTSVYPIGVQPSGRIPTGSTHGFQSHPIKYVYIMYLQEGFWFWKRCCLIACGPIGSMHVIHFHLGFLVWRGSSLIHTSLNKCFFFLFSLPTLSKSEFFTPIASTYGIYTYIYHYLYKSFPIKINHSCVYIYIFIGKYTWSPIDPMGTFPPNQPPLLPFNISRHSARGLKGLIDPRINSLHKCFMAVGRFTWKNHRNSYHFCFKTTGNTWF